MSKFGLDTDVLEKLGEDITKEYEGFITKLKEVDNDEL
jgi:hypothetical protein